MFPLGAVLLPGEPLHLQIFEPRYATMLDDLLAGDRTFGTVLIEGGSEVGGGDRRASVGTLARIEQWVETGPRRYSIACVGVDRIAVEEWLPDDPYPQAVVRPLLDEPGEEPDWQPLLEKRAALALLCGQGGRRDHDLRAIASRLAGPVDYLDGDPTAASLRATSDLPLGAVDRYRALAAIDAATRIDLVTAAVDDLIAALRFRLQA